MTQNNNSNSVKTGSHKNTAYKGKRESLKGVRLNQLLELQPKSDHQQMKCRHKNVQIEEEVIGWCQHSLIDRVVHHNLVEPNSTGALRVKCFDCGYRQRFSYNNCPKWVKSLLEKMLEAQDLQPLSNSEAVAVSSAANSE